MHCLKRRNRISAIIFKISSFKAKFVFDSNEKFVGTKEEKGEIIKSIKLAIQKERMKNDKNDDVEKISFKSINDERNENDNEKNIINKSQEQKRNSTDQLNDENKKESNEIIDENHFINDNHDTFSFTDNDQFFNESFDDCNINYLQWNDMLDSFSFNNFL